MTAPPQPGFLRFAPVYKDYVWGGCSLPLRLGRPEAPALDRYAESWELADHPDGMSLAEGGPFAGETLRTLSARFGAGLLGRTPPPFPLLIKILDAADKLSVQVHPDDECARRDGGEAKTECWYVLDAAPGAAVWAGLKPGVTEALFRSALAGGTVQDQLQRIPVHSGDLLFIPGGRVHAIGAGCLILEVQQNSNTTYRVFDWNRPGVDGKPRPLHVEQALKSIRWDEAAPALVPRGPVLEDAASRLETRLFCPYFKLEELTLRGPFETRHPGVSFHALFTVSGALRIRAGNDESRLPPGRTGLLPACVHSYTLAPEGLEARVIRISVPD
jgi:mannose-6-phosphate isomerase